MAFLPGWTEPVYTGALAKTACAGHATAFAFSGFAHECRHPAAHIQILRFHPRRLRLRAAVLEPDRPGEDRAGASAADRRTDVRRRRVVLSDLVHLRRHPHRGVRLRTRAARDLVGSGGA